MPSFAGVMGQVPFPPKCLRYSEQQAQKQRKNNIQKSGAKEGTMNEIMCDGVRVPPEPERDDREIGEIQNERGVHSGQQNEKGIPVRIAEDGPIVIVWLGKRRPSRRIWCSLSNLNTHVCHSCILRAPRLRDLAGDFAPRGVSPAAK